MARLGINLRATNSGSFASLEGADQTYLLGGQLYDQNRDGQHFGHSTSTSDPGPGGSGGNVRDRLETNPPELAGLHFGLSGDPLDITVGLTTTGNHEIHLAIGDAMNNLGPCEIRIYDDTTLMETIAISSPGAANSFRDATNAVYTAANWVANEAPVTVTFSTTIMRVVAAVSGGSFGYLCHIAYEAVSGGSTVTCTGVASSAAYGTTVVNPGPVTLSASGVASVAAYGTAVINPTYSILASAIANADAYGTATLNPGAVSVSPTGVSAADAYGSATVNPGTVTILPLSLSSGEAYGTARLVFNQVVSVLGIDSASAFGATIVGDYLVISTVTSTIVMPLATAVAKGIVKIYL